MAPAGRALSDVELLDIWEAGRVRTSIDRVEVLYGAAEPEGSSSTAVDELPLGVVDGTLMDCRAATFGPVIEAVADCPACDEQLTFDLDLRRVRVQGQQAPVHTTVNSSGRRHRVTVRLLTLADLRAAAAADTVDEARLLLTRRCVVEAWVGGKRTDPDALPSAVLSEIGGAMARQDPQADTRLAMTCPACEHAWEANFDIAAFLWLEIERAARRAVVEVHTLAAAYGWTEAEILAMPRARRRRYLELVLG
jgi:hypothetical protein